MAKAGAYDGQKHGHKGSSPTYHLTFKLSENQIAGIFEKNTSGGSLQGNHWVVGSGYIGRETTFVEGPGMSWRIRGLSNPGHHADVHNGAASMLGARIKWPLEGLRFVSIAAERDVRPETMSNTQDIAPSGAGLTNAITRQINDSSLDRQTIETYVLRDINEVYKGDADFSEILTRLDGSGEWEIYLRESTKGDIRLSQSGSGLKTILFITTLLNLRDRGQWQNTIFAIDEPENNLHPFLFRRLLEYLAKMRELYGFTLIITTHSPIGIDWASRRDDSQVIHVRHDGVRAKLSVAQDYGAGRDILDDLDIRASDLLQANGVIWVEGPSDRIYVRSWISLFSSDTIKEGIHYSIMFYGGKLLSHLSGDEPKSQSELIALLSLNRNAALIIDSDRRMGGGLTKSGRTRRPRVNINSTKRRLKDEFERLRGMVWITEGKEIENYVGPRVLAEAAGLANPLLINPYDEVISNSNLISFKQDKVALASRVADLSKASDLEGVLDLTSKLTELCAAIRRWNGPS